MMLSFLENQRLEHSALPLVYPLFFTSAIVPSKALSDDVDNDDDDDDDDGGGGDFLCAYVRVRAHVVPHQGD